MSINFKEIKKNAWIINSRNIDLTDKKTMQKVENWATLRGIEINDLLSDIKQSKYFKYAFCKDPNKQNIYEKAELNFLKNIHLIKNVIKLENSGENALYVNNHILAKGEDSPKIRREKYKSKSIDFKFTILPHKNRSNKLTCYAMHKYTEINGGAQDNQFQDLRIFLENSPLERGECFIALADGEYYTKKIIQLKKEFDIISKRRVFTSNELEEYILSGEVI